MRVEPIPYAELLAKYHNLLADFADVAGALECATSTRDVQARVAGLVQLERDVQDAVDYRRQVLEQNQDMHWNSLKTLTERENKLVVTIVEALADARPRNQFTHARRAQP